MKNCFSIFWNACCVSVEVCQRTGLRLTARGVSPSHLPNPQLLPRKVPVSLMKGGNMIGLPALNCTLENGTPPVAASPHQLPVDVSGKMMVGGEKKAGVTDLAGRRKQGPLQSTPIPCRYWRSYRFRVPSSTGR